MAHEITIVNGQAQIVVARQDAWHQLGKRLENCFTAAEGMLQIGLPTNLEKVPLTYTVSGITYTVPDKVAIVDRDSGKSVGIVGPNYGLLDPTTMFNFVDAMVGESLAAYESMGSCRNGSVVFAGLRLAELQNFTLPDGDTHEVYLNAVNSYDGSFAFTPYCSVVRPVCMNTLCSGLNSSIFRLKFKHSAKIVESLKSVQNMHIGLVNSVANLQQRFTDFANALPNREQVEVYLGNVLQFDPADVSTRRAGHVRQIMDLYFANDNNAVKSQQGTLYNLLNSVIEYADHFADTRVTGKRQDSLGDNAATLLRAESAIIGNGARLKERAFAMAEKLLPECATRTMVAVPDGTGQLVYEVVEEMEPIGISDSSNDASGASLLDSILSMGE